MCIDKTAISENKRFEHEIMSIILLYCICLDLDVDYAVQISLTLREKFDLEL